MRVTWPLDYIDKSLLSMEGVITSCFRLVLSCFILRHVSSLRVSECDELKAYSKGTLYEKAVHYWPFVSRTMLEDAITCQSVQVYGTPSDVSSNNGLYGITTDGSSGLRLSLSSEDDGCLKSFSNCTNGFTLSFWIKLLPSHKLHSSSVFDVVMATHDSLVPTSGFWLKDHYQEGLQASVSTNTYTEITTISMIRDAWNHVVITWTANDKIMYYVNGEMSKNLQTTFTNGVKTTVPSLGLYLSYSTVAGNASASYRDLAIWNQRISEKDVIDLYHHTSGCQEIDSKIWNTTASSYSGHYDPSLSIFESKTAWCEDPDLSGGFLGIELPSVHHINGLVLKDKDFGEHEFIKSFTLKFSVDAITWQDYKESGTIKTFTGLTSAGSFKRIIITRPTIVARYVRIYPTTSHGRKCLRIRLCGVEQDSLHISSSVQGTTCSVQVNNIEYCPNKDGHNVMAFSYQSGQFLAAKNYDTHQTATAGDSLEKFISSLENDTLVVVAVKTSGHRISNKGQQALYKIGAKSMNPPPVQISSILIGLTGSLAQWIQERFSSSTGKLVALNVTIPLKKDIELSHFWPLQKVDYYKKKHNNPKYYKHMRDVRGGMNIQYVHHLYILMGLLFLTTNSRGFGTLNGPNSCFLKPSSCLGGVTVSAWLKFEHFWLTNGEVEERSRKIPFQKTHIILNSQNAGYISIEGKKRHSNEGHHVILMEYATGKIRGEAVFDIPKENSAEERFDSFIKTAPNGTIILICSRYTSHITSSNLINTLRAVGARTPQQTTSDEVYLFVGYKGLDSMKWIEEAKFENSKSGILRLKVPIFGAWTSEAGMQDGRIQDWQLFGSGSNINDARLYGIAPGWISDDSTSRYSIRFKVPMVIVGLVTQGSSTHQAWVKSYKLSYKIGNVWFPVKDDGIPTEFVGNTDQHTPSQHTLRHPINVRKLQIKPVTFHNKIGMRIELLELNNAYRWMNDQPLDYKQEISDGVKGLVFNGNTNPSRKNITASSVRGAMYRPENAALHSYKTSLSSGCWCPNNDQNQHLSIDLSERSLVTSIGTQGCPSSNEWIKEFTVKYKDVDGTLNVFTDNQGQSAKVLTGNFDRHTVVMSHFERAVYAAIIEIHPTSWNEHACFRFEVFGFRLESECFAPILENSQKISSTSFINPFSAENSQLDAPSSAWCTELSPNNYLQVDFGEQILLSGIATQGYDGGNWTKSFYVSYSEDFLTWHNHTRDDKQLVYKGNTDSTAVKISMVEPFIESRYIRIHPIEGNTPNMSCMRLEVFGCFKDNPSFQLSGPLEIDASDGSDIIINANYRYCRQGIQYPRCKRQLYMDVFGTVQCLTENIVYDCQYNQVKKLLRVPELLGVYPIWIFDSIGENCKSDMKRTVPGKIIGRVLAKEYSSKSCLSVLMEGNRKDGIYNVRPDKSGAAIRVYCDQMRHGGGWTVIQRRVNGTIDFYKNWSEYQNGFGSLEGEFWLGNDNIHRLTSDTAELLVEMEKFDGSYYFAKYNSFQIGSQSTKYKMAISGYSGTAGDSLTKVHNGAMFSTKDKINDPGSSHNCSVLFQSGWWFKNCKDADLNGCYVPQEAGTAYRGLKWESLLGINSSLKKVAMKIRPRQGSTIKCYDWGCFYVNKWKSKTTFDARKDCWSMGGELATIRDSNEAKDVASMIDSIGATIGLNDVVAEGKTQGFGGDDSTYTNWKSQTSHSKDCVRLGKNTKLYPVKCTDTFKGYVCQKDLMCYKSSCYRLTQGLATRNNARTSCQTKGHYLMKIPGNSKSKFVLKYVMPNPRKPIWIGLSDELKEGTFLWSDGSKLSIPNWKTGHPRGEDCVVINTEGEWETKSCAATAGQVCQKQIDQVVRNS